MKNEIAVKTARKMYESSLKRCPFCGGQTHVAVCYPDTKRDFCVVEYENCGTQSA